MNQMPWDETWEDVFQDHHWGRYPSESLVRFIGRNFSRKGRKLKRVLEIGCGPGANIWFLSREGFNVYGVDGSRTAITRASARLKAERLKAKLMVGDISTLDFEDNFFDLVVDIEALCCNSRADSRRILSEVERVLKPGGFFFSQTFTDRMHVGASRACERLSYSSVVSGPLEGKGFVRLTDRSSIRTLYCKDLELASLDRIDATSHNGRWTVSEWLIVTRKKSGPSRRTRSK